MEGGPRWHYPVLQPPMRCCTGSMERLLRCRRAAPCLLRCRSRSVDRVHRMQPRLLVPPMLSSSSRDPISKSSTEPQLKCPLPGSSIPTKATWPSGDAVDLEKEGGVVGGGELGEGSRINLLLLLTSTPSHSICLEMKVVMRFAENLLIGMRFDHK